MQEDLDDIRAPHLPPKPPAIWQFRQFLFHLWSRTSPNVIILGLLAVFLLLSFWSRIVYTVQPGQRGVLFELFGGTYLADSFSEGIHFINPINSFYLYDVRLQEKHDTVVVLSNNGLDIRIQVVYRFHPIKEEVPQLHQQIGPNYEKVLVSPSVISSIREVIGRYRPEEIYTTHTNIIPGEVFAETRKRLEGKHVFMESVIIENISLPPSVQTAIVNKHVVEQELLTYEFKLAIEEKERKRREIEALGYQRYNEVLSGSLTHNVLVWSGIQATNKLATSPNAKMLIMGGGSQGAGLGLPLILGGQMSLDQAAEAVTGSATTPAATEKSGAEKPAGEKSGKPDAPAGSIKQSTPAVSGSQPAPTTLGSVMTGTANAASGRSAGARP